MAYGNLSCLEVITHLKNNNYKITPSALNDNSAWTTSAYDMNQPFETVVNQIETDFDFVDSGTVYCTPEQVAPTTYDQLFSTGYFINFCQRWNTKPSAQKTWSDLKLFFDNKHRT